MPKRTSATIAAFPIVEASDAGSAEFVRMGNKQAEGAEKRRA